MKCSLEYCENEVTTVTQAKPLCDKHRYMSPDALAQEKAAQSKANKAQKPAANKAEGTK